MRKLFAFFFLAALGLSAVGCGGDDPKPSGGKTAPANTTPEAPGKKK